MHNREMIPIILAVFAFAANNICTRVFQLRFGKNNDAIHLYQFLFCLVAATCFYLSAPNFELPEGKTLLLGGMFGIFFCLTILCIALCFKCGPMSLTGIIVNMSLVIPLSYSFLFMGEGITLLQAIGFVLLVVTIILSGRNKNENGNSASMQWIVLVLIAFISNGLTAVIQKQYKASFLVGQSSLFMAVAYFTAAAIFGILYIIKKRRYNTPSTPAIIRIAGLAVLSIISGWGSFWGNGILMRLSTEVNASILYPCINGGLCIVLALASFTFFKEKLTRLKALSIGVGLIAILIINL